MKPSDKIKKLREIEEQDPNIKPLDKLEKLREIEGQDPNDTQF